MNLLSVHQVSKSHGSKTIFEGVSFHVHGGDRVGLMGPNGSGKSTLAKLLAGLELPDDGRIAVRKGLDAAFLPQVPVLDPERTVRELVGEGLARWRKAIEGYEALTVKLSQGGTDAELEAWSSAQAELLHTIEQAGGFAQEHRVDEVLKALELRDPEAKASTLSGGQQRRVALGRLLIASPDLAILDEPTNHLDASTIAWLEDWLVEHFQGALVLITHDRFLLERVCTRMLELERGKVKEYEGNYARYLELKAEELERDARYRATLLNTLRKERDWLSRSAPARTRKQTARIERAVGLEKEARETAVHKRNVALDAASRGPGPGAKILLELENLSYELDGRPLFKQLQLTLHRGERLGILGPNGCGKTTLLRAITSELQPTTGHVRPSPQATISFLDQHRADLELQKSIWDNVFEGSDYVQFGDEKVHIYSYLERFLFDNSMHRSPVSSLSGGERARLSLARALRRSANLLLLDEPTNDLDLPTLAALEDMLLGFQGAVVVVTHDRFFLERIATAILAFEDNGDVVRYAGGFEDYLRQREARKQGPATEPSKPKTIAAPASGTAPKSPPAKLSWNEQAELQRLPGEIDELEKALQTIDAQLADPELYAKRGAELPALQAKRSSTEQSLEARMARWEQLEEKQQRANAR